MIEKCALDFLGELGKDGGAMRSVSDLVEAWYQCGTEKGYTRLQSG